MRRSIPGTVLVATALTLVGTACGSPETETAPTPVTEVTVPAAAAGVYNLYRDPREEHPEIGIALWSGASFQDMAKRHMMTISKYPHAKLGKGRPYGGIENLRPESKETVDLFMSWH